MSRGENWGAELRLNESFGNNNVQKNAPTPTRLPIIREARIIHKVKPHVESELDGQERREETDLSISFSTSSSKQERAA